MRRTAPGLAVLALLLGCAPPSNAGKPAMSYERAIAELQSPDTWCDGAATLARLGDATAVVPILRAYESREERGKLCLLDALDALGAGDAAHAMVQSDDAEQRRMGAHLMELLPGEGHATALVTVAEDDDDAVRKQALRALSTQKQTLPWEAAMVGLLSSDHLDVRAQAVESLAPRKTETARAALRARLEVETDPELKAKLAAALGD